VPTRGYTTADARSEMGKGTDQILYGRMLKMRWFDLRKTTSNGQLIWHLDM